MCTNTHKLSHRVSLWRLGHTRFSDMMWCIHVHVLYTCMQVCTCMCVHVCVYMYVCTCMCVQYVWLAALHDKLCGEGTEWETPGEIPQYKSTCICTCEVSAAVPSHVWLPQGQAPRKYVYACTEYSVSPEQHCVRKFHTLILSVWWERKTVQ